MTQPVIRASIHILVAIYLIIWKFSVKIIYFGSLNGGQAQLGNYYSKQRSELITRMGGERFKLKTQDQNGIDAMVFDRRR